MLGVQPGKGSWGQPQLQQQQEQHAQQQEQHYYMERIEGSEYPTAARSCSRARGRRKSTHMSSSSCGASTADEDGAEDDDGDIFYPGPDVASSPWEEE
jgi:transcription initiation factor TFIID subunit TAF12